MKVFIILRHSNTGVVLGIKDVFISSKSAVKEVRLLNSQTREYIYSIEEMHVS